MTQPFYNPSPYFRLPTSSYSRDFPISSLTLMTPQKGLMVMRIDRTGAYGTWVELVS
uniref:Uncharacterized protein n=1 Tax=Picea glauca TaxID=3330 RepID=A0A117NGC5_PICGL|nr:hypothetical protein ABT39_MTgene1608 [Picea glauca]